MAELGECITIDSSDSDDIQANDGKSVPNVNVESLDPANVKKRVQLVPVSKDHIFENFLKMCREADPGKDTDLAIEKIRKRFTEADSEYTKSQNFIDLLNRSMEQLTDGPWTRMKNISDELKFHSMKVKCKTVKEVHNGHTSSNTPPVVTDSKTKKHIAKLEKTISKLQARITKLEEQEVDFDESEDENSVYIKVSRYKERLCNVHRKVCELKRISVGLEPSRTLRFSATGIPIVNKAIEKFYNECQTFPDFRDILKVVEAANDKKSLNLTPREIRKIAETAFKQLGQTLKRHRLYELQNHISSYLPHQQEEDPAAADEELEKKLNENEKLYGNRIDEIIDKFAREQQTNGTSEPSIIGSDESSISDNDDNEEEDKNSVTSVSEYETDDSTCVPEEDIADLPSLKVSVPDVKQLHTLLGVKLSKEALSILSIRPQISALDEPCCSKSLVSEDSPRSDKRCHSSDDESDLAEFKKLKNDGPLRYSTPISLPAAEAELSVIRDLSDEDMPSESVPAAASEEVVPTSLDEETERINDESIIKEIFKNTTVPPDSIVQPEYKENKSPQEHAVPSVCSSVTSSKNTSLIVNLSNTPDTSEINLPGISITKTKSSASPTEQSKKNTTAVQSVENIIIPNEETKEIVVPKNTTNDDDIVIIDDRPPLKPAQTAEISNGVVDVEEEAEARKHKENEIIDIDKLANRSSTSTIPGPDLNNIIRQMNFKPVFGPKKVSIPRSSILSAPVYRLPLPKNAPNFLNPNNRVQNSMGNKHDSISNVVSKYRPLMARQIKRGGLGPRLETPSTTRPFDGNHWQQGTAMQKRTTQMNEVRFLQRNNQIVAEKRTTTVVEESMMQMSNSRSPVIGSRLQHTNGGRFVRNNVMHNSRTTVRREVTQRHQVVQRSRPSVSSEDVITLD